MFIRQLIHSESITYQLNNSSYFKKIESHNVGMLTKFLLSSEVDKDIFLSSPAYFLYTGRYGLWLYEPPGNKAIICWHPNTANQLLVFPSPGKVDTSLIDQVILHVPHPSSGILLCRILSDYITKVDTHEGLEPYNETTLDWVYPCQIISAKLVVACEGKAFSKFRNKINKIKRVETKEQILAPGTDFSSIIDMVHNWATVKAGSLPSSWANFAESALEGIQLCQYPNLDLVSIAVITKDHPVGLYSYQLLNGSDVTPAITLTPNRQLSGSSEYLYYSLSSRIIDSGKDLFAIGGSETEGLYGFRKKLLPVSDYKLYSRLFKKY